jgi:hypothetical protein
MIVKKDMTLFGLHNHVHINFVVVQCLGTGIGEMLVS